MSHGLREALLQEMLSVGYGVRLASVSVLSVDHDITDGNNYTSDMSRLRVRVVTESGEKWEVSLLVKQCMLNNIDNDVLKDAAELTTEIKIYKEILPAMERLMGELGNKETALWPHCIAHFDSSVLVLEDLKELGYQTRERIRGLDYPHARVAVRGLARFHALSIALKESGKLRPNEFSKFVFGGQFEAINGFISSSFGCLYKVASQKWSAEWKDIIDNVRRIPEMAVEKMREITRLEESKFHVLNHGDPWVNNMMFRHQENGHPDSIRFVDFQLSHYNSYAFDLHYLMNTSVSTEVLHHIDRLYEEYLEQLHLECGKLGIPSYPNHHELLEELQRTEFFGLFSAVCIAPVITAGPEIAPVKDSTGYSLEKLEKRKMDRYRTEEYTRRIQVILRRAQHGGLFKRLFI